MGYPIKQVVINKLARLARRKQPEPTSDPLADEVYEPFHGPRRSFDYDQDEQGYYGIARKGFELDRVIEKLGNKIANIKLNSKGNTGGTLDWYQRHHQRLEAIALRAAGKRISRITLGEEILPSRLPRPPISVCEDGPEAVIADPDEEDEEDEEDFSEESLEEDDSSDEDYEE